MGTLLVDGDVPFPRASPFGLTSCGGDFPCEGPFFVFFLNYIMASGSFWERTFCQLFGCKDFRGMILPLSIIRVRQSWDNETRVFARRRYTFSRQAGAKRSVSFSGGYSCLIVQTLPYTKIEAKSYH